MFTISYIVEDENNIFFKSSLQSSLMIADKILIVDSISQDGTLEMVNKVANDLGMSNKIEVIASIYQHDYIGANGLQRNQYLKWLKKNNLNGWNLVLDADEILSDNSFLLKDVIQTNPFDVYNIHMVHFIGNLGLVDATYERHYVNYRLFKVTDKLFYDEVEHPLLKSWSNLGQIENVTIFHFGYVKGLVNIIEKYNNHIKKSNIHNKEFLDNWKNWHVFGAYPVKPFTNFDSLPSTIKKEIGL